jgi:hypothetical protein
MTIETRPAPESAQRLTRDEVADLLQRYPHVSDGEAKAILGFLRKGRQLDVGLLTADDRLKPQLDSFMTDHRKDLRVGVGETAGVVAAIAGFLVACWLVWEAVKPAALTV